MSFPKSVTSDELRREFKSPPRGYGNVPFYWWNGDRLTKEKLRYELDILKESPLDGFAVSYVHTHPKADRKENAKGFGEFGRTEGGMPRVLSPEWMTSGNGFRECAKEAGRRLDDYTIAWTGNGFYPDQVRDLPQMQGYQGELSIRKDTLYHGEYYVYIEDSNRVSCIVFTIDGCAVAGQEITSSGYQEDCHGRRYYHQTQLYAPTHTRKRVGKALLSGNRRSVDTRRTKRGQLLFSG
ncbi:hypothetical protein MASR1M31_05420 [Porphyromonadaceae bacterium]